MSSGALASSVRVAAGGVGSAYEDAASATEASLRRSSQAHLRQRDALTRFVTGAAAANVATRDMGSSVDDMSRKTSRLSGAAGMAAGALKGIGIAGGVALAAGGAALGMFTMKGVQAAASFQQTTLAFESSFKSMGRSAEEAQQYLNDLRDFAAKTPFELTGLLDSVRGLMTIGKTPEAILQDLLPAIGDMASMMGVGEEAIGRVVFAFRQIAGSPKVLAQDLYQIQNALPGFNAKMGLANDAILAMAAGFQKGNIAEYQKAVESGAITGAMAVDALIRSMKKFPGAAGMMEKQSQTLTGVISTFKDEVNNALIDGFAPAIPAISGALLKLLPAVKALTTGFASAMGPVVAQIVNQVAPAFVEMSKVLAPILSQLISGLGPVLTGLLPLVGTLGQAVGGVLVGALRTLDPVIKALVPPIQEFLSVLAASLYPVIKALQPVLTDLALAFGQIITGLIPLLPAISQLLVASIQLVPSMTMLAISTNQLLLAVMPLINFFVQAAVVVMRFNPMVKLLAVQTQMLSRVMSALASVIAPIVNRLIPILNRVLQIAYKTALAAGAGVKELARQLGFIPRAISGAVDSISSFASSAKRKIASAADIVVKAWSTLKGALPQPVRSAISDILRAIANFGRRLIQALKDIGSSAMGAFTDGFKSKFPNFTGALGSVINAAVQTFSNADASFAAVGNNNAVSYQDAFMREMNRFAGNPMVGKALEGLMDKAKAGTKQAVPTAGGIGGGAAEGGGGGGGAAAAEEELKKWYKTIADFTAGLKQLAKNGITKGEVNAAVNRSTELLTAFSDMFGKADLKKLITKFAADGTLTAAEITKISNKLSNALKSFNNKAAGDISAVKKTFERFAELTLRAFDAETSRQSEAIRNRFAVDNIATPMKNVTLPDFGAVLDIGATPFADKLEGTIANLRNGLSSAITGLFGSGGTVDMSLKGITTRFNAAMKAIEAARNAALNDANRAREEEYAAAQTRREALTPAEQALADMNEQANTENLMRNKMDAEAALAAAQKIRSTKARNEAIQAAQRQLNEALRAIQMDALQKQAQEERKARESEYTEEITAADEKYNRAVEEADRLYQLAAEAAQAEYDAQVAQNKRMEEEEVRNNEFMRENQRIALENSLNDLRTALEQKRINWTKWKGDFKALMADPKFAAAMEKAGTNLGSEFSAGLLKSKNRIENALEEIAKLVERYLRVKSPTDLGPMNDLNKWWRGFGDTLIEGFDDRAFARKLGAAVAKVPARVDAGLNVMPKDDFMSIMPYPNGKGTGAPVTIQITVQGNVVQERDLAESIREELVKIGRRDGTIFGGIV